MNQNFKFFLDIMDAVSPGLKTKACLMVWGALLPMELTNGKTGKALYMI